MCAQSYFGGGETWSELYDLDVTPSRGHTSDCDVANQTSQSTRLAEMSHQLGDATLPRQRRRGKLGESLRGSLHIFTFLEPRAYACAVASGFAELGEWG